MTRDRLGKQLEQVAKCSPSIGKHIKRSIFAGNEPVNGAGDVICEFPAHNSALLGAPG